MGRHQAAAPAHGLALFNRLASEVTAIEFDEVEGAEHRRVMLPAPAKQLKVGNPVRVARDDLTVDKAGAHRECLDGGDDHGKPPRPIEAAPGDKVDALAIATSEHPIAVMLDLVKPIGAGGRSVRGLWEAWLEGQHGHLLGGGRDLKRYFRTLQSS